MPLLRAVNITVSTGAAIDIYFLLLAGVLPFSENVLPFQLNTSCREPLLQKKMSATECPSVFVSTLQRLAVEKTQATVFVILSTCQTNAAAKMSATECPVRVVCFLSRLAAEKALATGFIINTTFQAPLRPKRLPYN